MAKKTIFSPKHLAITSKKLKLIETDSENKTLTARTPKPMFNIIHGQNKV